MRCVRRQIPCPGYRDEVNLVFRNEDVSSLARGARRDRRKRPVEETGGAMSVRQEGPSALVLADYMYVA